MLLLFSILKNLDKLAMTPKKADKQLAMAQHKKKLIIILNNLGSKKW